MRLKWGVLGPGKIANKFVQDLLLVDGCELMAVGSRSLEKAENFGKSYGAERYYSSYQELYEDEEVDIIYVATPHSFHMECALGALNHGKHVLCEKPLAVNRAQVQKLVDASRSNNVFLMEAFWTRFNPSVEAILARIENNEIGKVNYVHADFSFYRDAAPESRLVNLDLAGGALLDIGVYPVFLAYLLMGYPVEILATANKHNSGADLHTAVTLKHKEGMANVMCGFNSDSDMEAKIYGTEGRIYIEDRWHESQGYRIEKGSEVSKFELPTRGKGFTYEIEECMNCIVKGRIDSEKWSHQDSLNLIGICDEIRKQIGLKYPFE